MNQKKKLNPPHYIDFLTWDLFCVNDDKNVDLENAQMMCCVICCNDF
jgi:hypothetical protein